MADIKTITLPNGTVLNLKDDRFRINDGVLEYRDGSTWKPATLTHKTDTSSMITSVASTAVSSAFTNDGYILGTLQVTGTCTSVKILCEGMVNSSANTWKTVAVINTDDYTVSNADTGITAKGIYNVDIAGFSKFRVRVTSISGGNVTVFGSFTS